MNLKQVLAGLLLGVAFASPQTGTKIDANTQIRNWQYTPLNGALPLGRVNLYTYDNSAIFQNLVNQANQSGLCKVYIPPGVWYVSQGIDVPTCVEFYGVGFGQGTDFQPTGPILGSVIQAQTGFTGPSGYPSNFMLRIDGSTSVGSEADTYNVNVHDLTFTCAGVANCSGFYVGHANEDVKVHDSVFANWTQYGEYHCGAGLGYEAWAYCGDNGSGPYYNNQLVSYGGWVTSSSYPLVIMSALGDRPWSNYTINTTTGPNYGVYMQGLGLSLSNIHMEGPVNGAILGPTSGLCAALSTPKCLGLQVADIDQVNLTTGSGYVIINQNSLSTLIRATRSNSQTTALINDQRNSVTVPNPYNGMYYLQDNGGCFSVEYCATFASTVTAPSMLIQSSTPTLTIKNSVSPYPYHALSEDASGQLTIGGSGGLRNVIFGDGSAVLSLRSSTSTSYNGVNLQSPLNVVNGLPQNAVFGSNVYYDLVNSNWKFGNIGGAGYSALWGSLGGGMGISASAAAQPGTVSNAQFLTNTTFYVAPSGNVLIAGTGSGGAYSQTDRANTPLQVWGNSWLTGNAYIGGTLTIAGGVSSGGQLVAGPSCTTAATAGSTCTTVFTFSPHLPGGSNGFFSCSILQNASSVSVTGVPVVSSFLVSNTGSSITVTIAALTNAAASGPLSCQGPLL